MKAMILAAGRGERMRPLTDSVPKPLLRAGGMALIEHIVGSLVRAGFRDLVVNHSHLGQAIEQALGDGMRCGARIRFSPEPAGALETGGGIVKALPLLGERFVVVNGDIWTDYPFERLATAPESPAHLVLVDNPSHHPQGDFSLRDGSVRADGSPRLTFAGIGVYRASLFAGRVAERFPLVSVLRDAMDRGQVSGEHYGGRWFDIGTPERLRELDALLAARR